MYLTFFYFEYERPGSFLLYPHWQGAAQACLPLSHYCRMMPRFPFEEPHTARRMLSEQRARTIWYEDSYSRNAI